MRILAVYIQHDACAAVFDQYELLAAVAQERPTRRKGDGGCFPTEAVRECLAQARLDASDIDVVCLPRTRYPKEYFTARAHLPFPQASIDDTLELIRVMARNFIHDPLRAFDARTYLADHGLHPSQIHFYNHHRAHALSALFSTRLNNVLVYTSDGGGDRTFYSACHLSDGQLVDLFGGEAESVAFRRPQTRADSLGHLYYHATQALGFRPLRHEGKVLGLAAFGRPTYAQRLRRLYTIAEDGQIKGLVRPRDIVSTVQGIARDGKREDVAASVQEILEELTLGSLERILQRCSARSLALSGGVFANVKLTQRISERFPLEEIFVYPAMSDQGEAEGGALSYLFERDGPPHWLAQRRRLTDVYLGRDYSEEADEVLRAGGAEAAFKGSTSSELAQEAAYLIASGKIVGTYLGRGEYGPRALGARSIMASAVDRNINDWLNKRLERTEFMPFAPVVRKERASELFDLPPRLQYTAQFMTVTCNVREAWKGRIPAVVHVDGTARPQIIERATNPLYYDVLERYERLTGIPALINTSFNVHEEPIINRPQEALKALEMGRVDFVLTQKAIWGKSSATSVLARPKKVPAAA